MGHYALISNLTTTVTERQELEVLYQTKQDIIDANIQSAEYQALLADYNSKDTSETLENLQSQLPTEPLPHVPDSEREIIYETLIDEDTGEVVGQRPIGFEPTDEEKALADLQAQIDAEINNLAMQKADLMQQMQIKQNEGTETVDGQIAAKITEIEKKPSIVESVITGIDETIEDRPVGDIMDLTPEQIAALPTEKYDNTTWIENMYKTQTNAQDVKRTSYNTSGGVHLNGGTPFRKNYAGKGYLYDPVRDAFYTPQPYASWTLNETSCVWEPPTPAPEGEGWIWDEETQTWKQITE